MSDSRFLEFVKIFQERVRESRLGEPDTDGIMPLAPKENAFTTIFLEDMEDMGLIPDSHIVHYEKKLGRANGKINGYAITEDEGKLHLCTSVLG